MAKKYDLILKGYVGGWDFNSTEVDDCLAKNPKEINVLIDSTGGSVATALSICSAFREHGNVNVHYRGMNASAATIASLGAKHISIDSSAMYLVHKCSNFVFQYDLMNADKIQQVIEELEQQKKDLEKIDLNIAALYAKRCKKDKDSMLALMKVGGWLSAEEAKDYGFVDEIIDTPAKQQTVDNATAMYFAAAGFPIPDTVRIADKSMFRQFFENTKESFREYFSEIFEPKKQPIENETPKTNNLMNKKFTFLCELLGLEAFAFSEGKTEVSDEQMQAVEDKISSMNEEIANLKADIAEKESQISALKAQPADTTTEVVGNGKTEVEDEQTGFFNAIDKANELLKII